MSKIKLNYSKNRKVWFSENLKKEEIQKIFNSQSGLVVDRAKLAHIVMQNPYKSIIHTLLDAEVRVELKENTDTFDTMGNKVKNFRFVSFKRFEVYPYSFIYKGVASRDLDCSIVDFKFNDIFEYGES